MSRRMFLDGDHRSSSKLLDELISSKKELLLTINLNLSKLMFLSCCDHLLPLIPLNFDRRNVPENLRLLVTLVVTACYFNGAWAALIFADIEEEGNED